MLLHWVGCSCIAVCWSFQFQPNPLIIVLFIILCYCTEWDVAALQFVGPSSVSLTLIWLYITPPPTHTFFPLHTHCFSGDLGTLSLGIPYLNTFNATKVARWIYGLNFFIQSRHGFTKFVSHISFDEVHVPLFTKCYSRHSLKPCLFENAVTALFCSCLNRIWFHLLVNASLLKYSLNICV